LPPLAVWLLALGTLWLVASRAGFGPWHPATWARWDSALYQDIAKQGYTLFRCGKGYPPGSWCGNAAWFPGYPLAARALALTGIPLLTAFVAVSWLFAGGTLVLLWCTFLSRRLSAAGAVALVYAAWAPGQIYFYAVYPLSMLTFFSVGYLWCLSRQRFVLAALSGAAAVLAYPIGLTLPVAGAVWILLAVKRGRMRALVLAAGVPPLAFAGILVAQYLQTGHWDAFFKVQAKYGHGLHDPLGLTYNLLVPLTRGHAFERGAAPSWQTLLVSLVLLAMLAALVWRRRGLVRTDVLLGIWALAAWGLPLTQANVSIWRSQAALLPLAPLLTRVPSSLRLVFAGAAIVIGVLVELRYLHGQLM
jgi:hypothetical protein